MVTNTDVKQFQKLYSKQFGIEIDKKQAYIKLCMLVRQMEVVCVPTYEFKEAYENETSNEKPASRNSTAI